MWLKNQVIPFTEENFDKQISSGKRFRFGKNWSDFLQKLNQGRIAHAQSSLQEMLGESLKKNQSFIDIGSGSGLSSLAAWKLGLIVTSFDFDRDSVMCTSLLKEEYAQNDPNWKIHEGSILDPAFISKLGLFDVVYSWGVLHHTGRMWDALNNAVSLVKPGGVLFIALYNDQGFRSKIWTVVKRLYNANALGRLAMTGIFVPYFFLGGLVNDLFRLRNPLTRFSAYQSNRGMSLYNDWIDWIGGYPFEVASTEIIESHLTKLGFERIKLKKTSSLGCNEFVYRKQLT